MKILISAVLTIMLVILAGACYQWSMERADRASIPGELVEVDGDQLHLLCKGEGRPLVLLENGLWGSYPDWLYVLDAVSEQTRVCTYDRLGLGWSSANHRPTLAADVAGRLNRLLQVSGLEQATILVGFSAGGLYVREYYNTYPEQVVGMVLLDSTHEQQAFRMPYMSQDTSLQRFCAALSWTGVGRAFDLMAPFVEPSFGPELYDEQMRVYNRTGFCKGLLLQTEGFEADLRTNQPPESLDDLPLVVIRAGKTIREQEYDASMSQEFLDGYDRNWPLLQEELATLSSRSIFMVAQDSGHAIQLQQPAIAFAAIMQLVDDWRAGVTE